MQIEIITLILSIVAIILTSITAGFSILAYSRVVGLENSTHRVEMVPLNGYSGPTGDDMVNQMGEAFGYNVAKEEKDITGV